MSADDVISFNAAVSAGEKGDDSSSVPAAAMTADGVISFNAAISSFDKDGHWQSKPMLQTH
eukprot:3776518-Karenia_brevis.AAC.1